MDFASLDFVYDGSAKTLAAHIHDEPGTSCTITPARVGPGAGSTPVSATCSGTNYTASGSGTEADTAVHSIAIGSLAVTDFPVSVEEDGGASLLGMTFLRRMKSMEIRNGRLYLRW